ncbi:prepilin-type N-terminal cleavage/methylation domain-containing protein [Photobacterium sanctipauli]|uniref:Prepilin-type N-terminal cleavage/methylation domain-containing protein n=1 Tax=Photobacterium sanctipauli TaxID=1342794 RepID=A0A2T3N9K4_9GAMM|nr:prepilin-type N-terminal cleavage/methylation domain-containing protein [Photobacterium sanctipauli]PSW10221.1 prepilin-type N-terminal cleavage/methylation domain-containing protein [Photobacterium sanctipauli]
MKKQSGFSLVELVIVIIVVGLLAVAALPRFMNVTDEAKKASIEGVAGGYATAVLSVRAQWEAYGRPENSGRNTVDYDGTDFYLTQDGDTGTPRVGYPISTRNVSVDSMVVSDCVALMDNLLQNPPKVTSQSTDAQSGKFLFYTELADDNGSNTCRYYQLASTGNDGNGTTDVTSGHYFTYLPMDGSVQVEIR